MPRGREIGINPPITITKRRGKHVTHRQGSQWLDHAEKGELGIGEEETFERGVEDECRTEG